MPRIEYEPWNPSADTRLVVERADTLAEDYADQGYDLTLRQLYYQFVARDWLPNTTQSYKRLGDIVNKARLAGMLDWSHITDRTRNLGRWAFSTSPEHSIDSIAEGYALDHWPSQPTYVEVWVEKEALAGVVSRAAMTHGVPYFSCRGYVSQSEMWGAARRLLRRISARHRVTILHLGDHDPSGMDMTRDIRERLEGFITSDWLDRYQYVFPEDSVPTEELLAHMADQVGGDALTIKRIALNRDQIDQYDPPPNPAKVTDSRFDAYQREHGDDSWELDALEPSVLDALISAEIEALIEDPDAWARVSVQEENERQLLRRVSAEWHRIQDELGG